LAEGLILIQDLIDTKLRKEKELEFYAAELEKLQTKMFWVKKEIEVTETIMHMIEQEKILDLNERIREKRK
jgi:hypothetical protein